MNNELKVGARGIKSIMNDELKVGARSKPYIALDEYPPVIVVDELQYDASYDAYYKRSIIINANPTPAEIFKIRLTNPQ